MHGNVIWSRFIWIELIWSRFIFVGVSQVNRIRVFVLNFFKFRKNIAPRFLKILLQTGSSLCPTSCLVTFRLVKYDTPLKGNLPELLNYGIMVPISPRGFNPVRLSIFCPYPLLWTSVPLLKIWRGDQPRPLCTDMVNWVDWKMVGWILGLFWRTLWLMKGCAIPTDNSSDHIVPIGSSNCFIPALLVWEGCSVDRWLGRYSPSRVVSNFRFLR